MPTYPRVGPWKEHQNNQQVDQAAKIEVAQVDLDWQRKGELFIARWAHDTSGHQGRDATYRWGRDQGVDLSMDAISQVIHQCETCAAIKQAKQGRRTTGADHYHNWQQYCSNRGSLVPIHKLIRQLESQGVISRTHSPFNSPIWPVRKSNGEWRLTVDYHGLNEVTLPMSAAVPDMLELQYELESKAAKWYATTDIANAFFSIPLVAECRPQFAFTWRGIQYTWNQLPQGWKHSPTICHGLIQTALEQGEALEHLQ
ncbi:hypothetical protein GRJ2_003468800 [Grus japonensis]|uniref:ribonuclease H n=1 Tax=Grus japonensis TaxID=30415 RepID=A0ABC9YKV0_GRUJA